VIVDAARAPINYLEGRGRVSQHADLRGSACRTLQVAAPDANPANWNPDVEHGGDDRGAPRSDASLTVRSAVRWLCADSFARRAL